MSGDAAVAGILPEGIDAVALAGLFRRALDHRGDLVRWRSRRLATPRVASTRGVFLIDGTLADSGKHTSGRLALKVLAPPMDGALPREAALSRSGLLDALPDGLGAPRCFGSTSLPDGSIGLWLEYLDDADGAAWSVERFGDVRTR